MHDGFRWALAAVAATLGLAAAYPDSPLPWEQASLSLIAQTLTTGVLVWAALSDLRTKTIPNLASAAIALLALGYALARAQLSGADPLWSVGRSLLGGIVLGGGCLVLALAFEAAGRGQAIGGGDIKLLAALGLAFGWERGLLLLALACTAFLAWAAIRQLLGFGLGRAPSHARSTVLLAPYAGAVGERALPFAPALALGSYVTMLCF